MTDAVLVIMGASFTSVTVTVMSCASVRRSSAAVETVSAARRNSAISGGIVVVVVASGTATVVVVPSGAGASVVVTAASPSSASSAGGKAFTNTQVNPMMPTTTKGRIHRPGFGSSLLICAKDSREPGEESDAVPSGRLRSSA